MSYVILCDSLCDFKIKQLLLRNMGGRDKNEEDRENDFFMQWYF